MVDRIANPWGERTPLGQGEDWPIRVDQFLEDGISEEEVDRWVQTASILHSNGDAYDIAVKDGRIVGVRGRDVHVFVETLPPTSSPTTSREELYPSSEATTLLVAARHLNARGRCASW
jgi:hypothetical protein